MNMSRRRTSGRIGGDLYKRL